MWVLIDRQYNFILSQQLTIIFDLFPTPPKTALAVTGQVSDRFVPFDLLEDISVLRSDSLYTRRR